MVRVKVALAAPDVSPDCVTLMRPQVPHPPRPVWHSTHLG